jgi:hypothetical protein
MDIPEIGNKGIVIRQLDIPDISASVVPEPRYSIPSAPPVTVNIGVPVVDLPGCVEAHETNNPKNNQVTNDDENGLVTYCDSGVPSFAPIDYEPDQLVPTGEAKVPAYKGEEVKPSQDVPESPKVPETPVSTAQIECPTEEQLQTEPVGFIFDSGRKKITGYRLEGNQCIREVEDIPIVNQVINAIPPASTITTTASIAVVATTSALLAKPFADILLRVVKPVTKKIIKKIASIRGKETKVESVAERRDAQRDRNDAIKSLKKVLKK